MAEIYGGVGALAEALGASPRTLHRWAHGTHSPSKTAAMAIAQTFMENGFDPPPFPNIPTKGSK
jgi:DNA-binding XRE family transcriptional regulator